MCIKIMERIHQFVSEQFNADRMIRLAAHRSDVEVLSNVYFKQGLSYDKNTAGR